MGLPLPLYSLNKSCEEAIEDLTRRLKEANFQVVRTFDLQTARIPVSVERLCACPHHGTKACGCQLVVLLVYAESPTPTSLVVHGHKERTWFELVDTPEQRADPLLKEAFQQVWNNRI
jgi:hypothetical protein